MEFIINNIGSNKVNIPIFTNEFEETNSVQDDPSIFENIESLIDVYKHTCKHACNTQKLMESKSSKSIDNINTVQLKCTDVVQTVKKTKNASPYTIPIINIEKNNIKYITGIDGLLSCIIDFIEPTSSLLSYESKMEKINKLKKQMLLDLNDPSHRKKTLYTNEDIIKYIETSDEKMCIYLCKLLSKNIAIRLVSDNSEYNLFKYDDTFDCLIIDKTIRENDMVVYTYYKTDTFSNTINDIITQRVIHYIKDGTSSKLDSLLVKDLKELANNLEVPLFYKDDENKKKPYLKNELKDEIKKKFDLYKQ